MLYKKAHTLGSRSASQALGLFSLIPIPTCQCRHCPRSNCSCHTFCCCRYPCSLLTMLRVQVVAKWVNVTFHVTHTEIHNSTEIILKENKKNLEKNWNNDILSTQWQTFNTANLSNLCHRCGFFEGYDLLTRTRTHDKNLWHSLLSPQVSLLKTGQQNKGVVSLALMKP